MSLSRLVPAGILTTALFVALALPAVAKKAKVPPCPAGNYVLDVAEGLGPAGAPGFPDVIAVDEAGRVSVESSCPLIEGKVKGSKKGTKVSAKWKKETCAQLDGKVKLKAKTDLTCQTLVGKFKAKKHKVKFTATRAPAVTVELEAESRAATTLGPDGGSVSATGADGTLYTLVLPEGALAIETEIAITPVAAIADLPVGTLAGAAQFEPEGLLLFGVATLTIEPPGGVEVPDGQVVAGFDYTRAGDDFGLGLVSEDGASITVPVLHFSGAGSFFADPNDFDLSAQGTPGAEPFITELFLAASESDGDVRVALTVGSLENWYSGVVRSRLQAAVVSDPALVRGAAEFARWREAVVGGAARLVDIDAPALLARFESELAEAEGLLAVALRDGIARANASCLAEETLVGAEDALRWMHVARALLSPETVTSNLLDNDSVLAELCVEILFEEVSYPEAPIAGEAETLTIVAGLAPRDGEIRFVFPLFVTAVGEHGVDEAFQQGQTGADGIFETFFTPSGGASVRIDIEACLEAGDPELALVGGICQTAFVVRGLIVSPIRSTLEPGASQQFTAELGGAAVPVTWSADGGTIDANGLFTAGNQNGTFTITATSVANPDQTSTSTVTIEGEPPNSGFPTFAVWEGPIEPLGRIAELQTSFQPSTGVLTVTSCHQFTGGAPCLGLGCNALWEGTVSGDQVSFTMFNHTSPCAIGDPGQNRLYGCEMTATFSEQADGTVRLAGGGDASFFSCGGAAPQTFEVFTTE
ncbi:MAG: Ig-like domain-containing protein [Myxococcales bacterium]|nr:Ig-like domain-containing protein [Myxococcales bacterium]